MNSPVDVYLSTGSDGADVLVGRARFHMRRGRLSTSFSYDEHYVAASDSFPIDPSLPLQLTPLHVVGLPGAMRDSAPDRWGRHLISRRLRASQVGETGSLRTLDDVDYLLGVHDEARQGALRYADPTSRERLSLEGEVPPRIELPRLLAASNRVAVEEGDEEDVKALLSAGSGSLGGARPKASIVDGSRILLAKFSHPGDSWRVMRWERFALEISREAGLPVPASRLVPVGADDVLLLERFDREGSLLKGRRVPYMSAMTLLGAVDGDEHDYAELAEEIPDAVGDVGGALRGLFARMVLSVALHNTDDHLRNVGLIRCNGFWLLAPCFDINPNPRLQEQRVTTLYGEAGREETRGLRALAELCGLGDPDAASVVQGVLSVMGRWRTVARRQGCPDAELALFAPVFEDRCEALRQEFL